jgi:ankyrin repeat protein
MIDLLVQHGLDISHVDEQGRNELHIALSFAVVARFEAVEYLVRAGVPLNARDFETHWFQTWLLERLTHDPYVRRQREDRATALLQSAGARL